MQPRFEIRIGRKPFRLITHPRFRAAYDFMLLRCESGELSPELGEWWKAFLTSDAEKREKMLSTQGPTQKKRKRRTRKKSAAPTTGGTETPIQSEQS